MHAFSSNPIDPGAIAGLGVGVMLIGLLIYLALLGLMIWIGYLITRTAVKNGVILALRETGQQLPPRGYASPAPPQNWQH